MKSLGPATIALLFSCGPALDSSRDAPPPTGLENNCAGDTECITPADAGRGCDADRDCPTGLVCVRSQGVCVLPEVAPMVDEPDAGRAPACQDGDVSTCGVSKLGECRLGTAHCLAGAWGPCEGAVGPLPDVCNGRDDDCDGFIDENMPDSSCGVGECRRTVNTCVAGVPQSCVPGAPSAERCNGLDDDCDGMIDEGLMPLSCGVGACARIVQACTSGQPQQCLPGMPSAEVCNGADDDCDGAADENLGSTTCGQGACVRTVQNCVGGVAQTCRPGNAVAETCNLIDDDCDGQVDEGLGNATCGLGACMRSVPACTNGVAGVCSPGSPSAETCNGIDDDCDGQIDDGVCAPVSTCPANRSVGANTSVTLSTAASSPGGRAITCQWSVASRPSTSSGTFGSPTSCTASTYFADVVGTHTLRFTVTDSAGVSSSCTVDVVVNPLGDLWVELTWDRNNDMDLHLQHPSGGNNHTANGWSSSASPYDCYWLDKTPSWDGAGTADDPSLDRDDIAGKGPENVRVNAPSTSHDYTVGVHMYSYSATQAVTATVKVYCGGTLMTTRTRSFNKADDMWVVGKVRFSSAGTCAFTYDGFVFNMP